MPAPGTPKIFQPALPMRGVTSRGEPRPLHVIISTRTPHAGIDGRTIDDVRAVVEFQPALPMRGVTSSTNATSEKRLFQPALPMRGVTRPQLLGTVNIVISTRTPHAGSDAALTFLWVVSPFQPALPMRGVTHHGRYRRGRHRFQPALPMRGVTPRWLPRGTATTNFNPHSPCGE